MNWYEITKKYNKVNYIAGSLDINKGLDCIGLLFNFYADMGVDLSGLKKTEFNYKNQVYTIDNYLEVEPDTKKRNKLFKVFLNKFFQKTDKLKKGNIIVFKFKKVEAVGIYVGKNLMLCVIENYGVRNIKIKNSHIQEIYKW